MTFDPNQLILNFSPGVLHTKIVEASSEKLYKISMIIMTLRYPHVREDAWSSLLCLVITFSSPFPPLFVFISVSLLRKILHQSEIRIISLPRGIPQCQSGLDGGVREPLSLKASLSDQMDSLGATCRMSGRKTFNEAWHVRSKQLCNSGFRVALFYFP